MAGFVGAGESVADIGSDHAYVPIYLVREGVSPFAILTDIRPGPLDRARKSVEKAAAAGGGEKFDLRLGDGLAVLTEGEVDTVIIAGLGGETIISVLDADPDKTLSFSKYILQPRTKTDLLGEWLDAAGWVVTEKASADERGRLCDIIVCSPMGAPKEEKT